MKRLKTKRYFGRKDNVERNKYFDDYMQSVAQSKYYTSDITCVELGFCTYFRNGCTILFWPNNKISLVQFCLIYVVT